MNKILLNKSIHNFRDTLILGVEGVRAAYSLYKEQAESRENDYPVSFEDFYHDWSQCLWELLVERVVCSPNERLTTYGAGSDYDANEHSHVFFQKTIETHEIAISVVGKCIDVLTNEKIDIKKYQFMEFVDIEDGWFFIKPPLDYIQLDEISVAGSSYRQVVIPVESVVFNAKAIET